MNLLSEGVSLRFVGWSPWLVVPLALLAAWLIVRLQSPEVANLPVWSRRSVLFLRGLCAALLVAMFLEPTFSHQGTDSDLPLVAVFVDQSGSMQVRDDQMAATDRLNEAVALKLIPADQRPAMDQRVADRLDELLRDLPAMARALNYRGPASQDRARENLDLVQRHVRQATELLSTGSEVDGIRPTLEHQVDVLRRLSHVLQRDKSQTPRQEFNVVREYGSVEGANDTDSSGKSGSPHGEIIAELAQLAEQGREQARLAREKQVTRDESLVRQAKPGSPVDEGLRRLAQLSRFERAGMLARDQLVPSLAKRARVKVYGLDDTLTPLDLSQPPKSLPGGATDFAAPLSFVAREWSQEHVGAVVMVTDGRQTAGGDPTPAIRALRARGAYVSGILVGDRQEPRDAVVSEVIGSSEVFVGEKITATARYRIRGFDKIEWDLIITADGKEVGRRTVRGDGDWQTQRFEFPATEAGTRTVVARLQWRKTEASGELAEASVNNNQAEMLVNVNQDPLKVLIVDAWPRWESRYLATLFEKDRRIGLVRRYRSVRVARSEFELLPTTQSELDSFDMLVLGDLAPGELGGEDQRHIADFVAKRGGFLVCVAGPRGMPGGYSLGGLADALPISVSSQPAETAPVSLALTEAGSESPITSVLGDPALNQRLWPALPPLQWIAGSVSAKPGATVLLEAQDSARTPIAAIHRYGAGRVLWMGTAESWRWRDRLGDRVHQTFWLQALRWGLGARLRGKDPRLQVSLDRGLLAPGESAELRGRALLSDQTVVSSPLIVRLERQNDKGEPDPKSARELEMSPVGDSNGIWFQALSKLNEGRWLATVRSTHTQLAGLTETREVVVRASSGLEGVELAADLPALTRLADAGGHRAGGFEQGATIVKDLASRLEPRVRQRVRTLSLWDNYSALLIVLTLLSIEWIVRKRRGLP